MEWYSYPALLPRSTIPTFKVHAWLAIDKSGPLLIPEIKKFETEDFLHFIVGE